jgi:hypothetical protein
MKLRVLQDYCCRSVVYRAGRVIVVSDEEGAWLLNDAPGCFELDEPKQRKAVKKPPADKMMQGAEDK